MTPLYPLASKRRYDMFQKLILMQERIATEGFFKSKEEKIAQVKKDKEQCFMKMAADMDGVFKRSMVEAKDFFLEDSFYVKRGTSLIQELSKKSPHKNTDPAKMVELFSEDKIWTDFKSLSASYTNTTRLVGYIKSLKGVKVSINNMAHESMDTPAIAGLVSSHAYVNSEDGVIPYYVYNHAHLTAGEGFTAKNLLDIYKTHRKSFYADSKSLIEAVVANIRTYQDVMRKDIANVDIKPSTFNTNAGEYMTLVKAQLSAINAMMVVEKTVVNALSGIKQILYK